MRKCSRNKMIESFSNKLRRILINYHHSMNIIKQWKEQISGFFRFLFLLSFCIWLSNFFACQRISRNREHINMFSLLLVSFFYWSMHHFLFEWWTNSKYQSKTMNVNDLNDVRKEKTIKFFDRIFVSENVGRDQKMNVKDNDSSSHL